jgi:hypothetical protein
LQRRSSDPIDVIAAQTLGERFVLNVIDEAIITQTVDVSR